MKISSKIIRRSLAVIPETSFGWERNHLGHAFEMLIHHAMETLTEKEKHLAVLRGWFGCSFYEIAVREHISVSAARMNYSRIIRKLKARVMRSFIPVNHIQKEQLLWEPY